MKRRVFLKKTAQSAALAGLMPSQINEERIKNKQVNQKSDICIFSKHLQWLPYDEMAQKAKELGFDGIDLTVRPNGHVLPENVEKDLPRAVDAVQKVGLKVPLITTNILDASDPITSAILETASGLGIKVYRTGWLKYNQEPVHETLTVARKKLQNLAMLNEKYKIKGGYQNHAGNYVGAPCWDLFQILKGVNPEYMGVQFDIRHAHVEGAKSWPYSLEILAPWINSIDIKDYRWELNQGEWKLTNVPLGQGMVEFDAFFKLLIRFKVNVDFSIHYEYPLGGAEHGHKKISIPESQFNEKVKIDLHFLQQHV